MPFPVRVKSKIKFKIRIKVKGVGQECPTHTGKGNIKSRGCAVGTPLRGIGEDAAQGVLRLRNHSASRSGCCAQDDNGGRVLNTTDNGEGFV